MNHNMALDIGTSGVRMAIKGRGVLYRHSSCVAQGQSGTVEVGNEALRLQSRTPKAITVTNPMSGIAILSESALSAWFQYLIRHAQGAGLVHRPRVLIAMAPDTTKSTMRQLAALCMESGAHSCSLVRSDICAALGAPLDLSVPKGYLVCQLGAGYITASVFAGKRVVSSRSLPFGMAQVDEAIIRRARAKHGIIIGKKAAEDLKLSMIGASAAAAPCATISAIDASSGFPKHFEVPSDTVLGAAEPVVSAMIELIHQTIDDVSAELAADIVDSGVVLTGGGAQLFGLPARIAEEFNLACHLPEDPSACAIKGLDRVMSASGAYDHLIHPHTAIMEAR